MAQGRTNAGSGMNDIFALIRVEYREGFVCTCSNGAIVITATKTDGVWLFNIPYAGVWTVKATISGYGYSYRLNVEMVEGDCKNIIFKKDELILFGEDADTDSIQWMYHPENTCDILLDDYYDDGRRSIRFHEVSKTTKLGMAYSKEPINFDKIDEVVLRVAINAGRYVNTSTRTTAPFIFGIMSSNPAFLDLHTIEIKNDLDPDSFYPNTTMFDTYYFTSSGGETVTIVTLDTKNYSGLYYLCLVAYCKDTRGVLGFSTPDIDLDYTMVADNLTINFEV